MALIDPSAGFWLTFVLGLSNLLFLALLALSCRCTRNYALFRALEISPAYRWLYAAHRWFWWLLAASIATHTTIALLTFGLPF